MPNEVLAILKAHAPATLEELQSGSRATSKTRGGKAKGLTMSKEPPVSDEHDASASSSAGEEPSETESEQETEVQHVHNAPDPDDDIPASDDLEPTLEEAALFCWESLFCPTEVLPTAVVTFWPLDKLGRAASLFAKILHDDWEPFFEPSEVEGNVADDPDLTALYNSFCQVH
jgi:hypothetical protein